MPETTPPELSGQTKDYIADTVCYFDEEIGYNEMFAAAYGGANEGEEDSITAMNALEAAYQNPEDNIVRINILLGELAARSIFPAESPNQAISLGAEMMRHELTDWKEMKGAPANGSLLVHGSMIFGDPKMWDIDLAIVGDYMLRQSLQSRITVSDRFIEQHKDLYVKWLNILKASPEAEEFPRLVSKEEGDSLHADVAIVNLSDIESIAIGFESSAALASKGGDLRETLNRYNIQDVAQKATYVLMGMPLYPNNDGRLATYHKERILGMIRENHHFAAMVRLGLEYVLATRIVRGNQSRPLP